MNSLMNGLKVSIKGFCMGIADLIPGVSGGTIALILGIYEELIESIKSFDLNFVRTLLRFRIRDAFRHTGWVFMAFLLLGIGVAILTMSKFLVWMLENKPEHIYGFFFGLIAATIPVLFRYVKKWTPTAYAGVVVSSAAAYLIVKLVPVQTPDTFIYIFLSGAIAICAMILPGISGSFLLVILGKYHTVLAAVHDRDLITIATFVLGLVTGILTFVRVVSWLLKHYHDITMACLTGFVIGALTKIWPWKETLETITSSKGKVIPLVEKNFWPDAWGGHEFTVLGMIVAGLLIGDLLGRCSVPEAKTHA